MSASTPATSVAELLLARGWRLATAESLTGGAIAAALTAVPGASRWFAGGCIVYQTGEKTRQLDVPPALIERAGVVSREVAEALVSGVRARFAVEAAVAVTGLAGPASADDRLPVGTVWIAAVAGEKELSRLCHFGGDRSAVRAQTVEASLALLLDILQVENL